MMENGMMENGQAQSQPPRRLGTEIYHQEIGFFVPSW